MVTFDRALNNYHSSRTERLKDFFDIDNDKDLEKTLQSYRDKTENHKKNIDMSSIQYIKVGLNEYKSEKFLNDLAKIVPMGTIKTGEELFCDYKMYEEIQIPEWAEDRFGNVYRRIRQ